MRTALAQPNPGLPLHLQQREQQRRLAAVRSALQALQQSLQLLRTVSAYLPSMAEAQSVSQLLAELCAAAPDEEHDACGLLNELPKTLCTVPAAGASQGRKSQSRSSKKSIDQMVLKLSEQVYPELTEAEDEDSRLQLEAVHVTTILESLLEQSAVRSRVSCSMHHFRFSLRCDVSMYAVR